MTHERRLDDAGGVQLAANLDLHCRGRVRGTRASAMERFKVGENVPLVTSPPAGAAAAADCPDCPGITTFW
jgi:hypothetical protein